MADLLSPSAAKMVAVHEAGGARPPAEPQTTIYHLPTSNIKLQTNDSRFADRIKCNVCNGMPPGFLV